MGKKKRKLVAERYVMLLDKVHSNTAFTPYFVCPWCGHNIVLYGASLSDKDMQELSRYKEMIAMPRICKQCGQLYGIIRRRISRHLVIGPSIQHTWYTHRIGKLRKGGYRASVA